MPAPPCGNYGDINNDGNVSGTDGMFIEQYLAGTRTLTPDQLIRADVGGDGIVTQASADLIALYIVGAISTFPVCSQLPPTEQFISFIIPIGATITVDGVQYD